MLQSAYGLTRGLSSSSLLVLHLWVSACESLFGFLRQLLLLSTLSASLLRATLVPESIKEHVLNLATHIVLSDCVEVGLCFLAGDMAGEVRQHLHVGENSRLVLLLRDAVVE